MQNTEPSIAPAPSTEQKVAFLSDPASYPHKPAEIEVCETHMSWVFLSDERVFKLKKPVAFDFLDFSTLEKRGRMVREEIRLNQRLAPEIYVAARTLRLGLDEALSIDGTGHIVDWLVEMRRLPDALNVETMISSGQLQPRHVSEIAGKLSEFYRRLLPVRISAESYVSMFDAQQRTTKAVLEDPKLALDGNRLNTALADFDAAFLEAGPALRDRALRGLIVEGHGDLRPQHIFMTETPAIIDCLEFNRSLRTVDPFDEITFLGMECAHLGADWVFGALASRLSDALDDRPPPELLSFYWRYRALLRARLALLHLSEIPPRTLEKWRPLTWRYIELAEQADVRTRLPEGR